MLSGPFFPNDCGLGHGPLGRADRPRPRNSLHVRAAEAAFDGAGAQHMHACTRHMRSMRPRPLKCVRVSVFVCVCGLHALASATGPELHCTYARPRPHSMERARSTCMHAQDICGACGRGRLSVFVCVVCGLLSVVCGLWSVVFCVSQARLAIARLAIATANARDMSGVISQPPGRAAACTYVRARASRPRGAPSNDESEPRQARSGKAGPCRVAKHRAAI